MSASSSAPSSPAASPSSPPAVLTPTRKVQALLADLSDSESDNNLYEKSNKQANNSTLASSSQSSEDEVVSRSRIANRLAEVKPHVAENNNNESTQNVTSVQSELQGDHISRRLSASSDKDDTEAFAPRKRLLLKRKISSTDPDNVASSPSNSGSRDSSVPASAGRQSLSPAREMGAPNVGSSPPADGKTKFLALVEKHRKERLTREAEEIAKRAARSAEEENSPKPRQGQRGSSPADGSLEDSDSSDAGAVKQLTKEARPIRKASKKAMEEMNRETQRISRNMQLTHQARTKKKITKESLLARFNFASSDKEADDFGASNKSATASSNVPTDDESTKDHTTPPTSPIQAPENKQVTSNVIEPILNDLDKSRSPHDLEDHFSLQEMLAKRRSEKGKERESSIGLGVSTEQTPDPAPSSRYSKMTGSITSQTRTQRTMREIVHLMAEESDYELEVVTDKGSTRKYVAFESLPKRKAKEAPSHLALRSLAHLLGNEEKKRSVNAAEMEVALRKAARKQAREERQAKIEELKAKGVFVPTAEEREREQQEVEDLVERARQEAAEIHKRERELAKKNGTLEKDALDDEDESDEDEDFEDEDDNEEDNSDSAEEVEDGNQDSDREGLIEEAAEEASEDEEVDEDPDENGAADDEAELAVIKTPAPSRQIRKSHIISDDEEEEKGSASKHSPTLTRASKTPQSVIRSARKMIPGLQMSDDLPLGLTQAFAATMADTESQDLSGDEGQDSMDIVRELPSLDIAAAPILHRLDSIDLVSDSQPASQTQPLEVNLTFSQSQRIPESPTAFSQLAQSQAPFDLTQDAGYLYSPFAGSRFSETPRKDAPNSTVDTVILPPGNDSPILQRKGKLRRGRLDNEEQDTEDVESHAPETAFQVMRRAAKANVSESLFDRRKSHARGVVDEAAEESDDEYAGLGGASEDDSNDEENEEDRKMIDENTNVGKGDEAKLAQLYANRERESDEVAVSKLLKDITTGALRRKRGAGDDLDLSDEEDAVARRRDAKRREFAKMRRELLKDEAVGKIAEDKRKEAFLRSIEDHELAEDENENDYEHPGIPLEDESQDTTTESLANANGEKHEQNSKRALTSVSDSQLNKIPSSVRRTTNETNRKPSTLAEIRESVSFLIEEPESQAGTIDLGLSDSEEEPEAYVNLDRHLKEAEADENADEEEEEDLGDFIVDDDGNAKDSQDGLFKKPELPVKERAPYSERRTKNTNVVDRLSLIRQASSSSSGSSTSSKMAFFTSKTADGSFSKAPSLLRRATTNSSLGSMSGRENVSATGVVTNKTERGNVKEEKEFVRKGSGTRRNAVNYQARQSLREEKMSARAGVNKGKPKKAGGGFLNGLFRSDNWQ